jgi:hypothetical protein
MQTKFLECYKQGENAANNDSLRNANIKVQIAKEKMGQNITMAMQSQAALEVENSLNFYLK